ncbi:hypothetical protein, partial [uncultured Rikenella sp.]|uniref:hypothetical protein n=1 Tax=uncultured Rikenella sp. TaxID=368003 RepID=UPI002615377F
RRLCEPQKLSQQLGPARRENRNRFSRLKNRHSPKLDPVLRPVSASLRLRLRSAAFATRWDFISILLTAKRAKSLLLKAGGRRIFARSRGFSRACAIHLYSATAEIVESLL